MQSALATTRPTKNRLFSLSLDLQALIYGYIDWGEDDYCREDYCYRPYRRGDVSRFRPDILQEHMRYYWACQYDIALRGMPTLKNAPRYFCEFCESIMHREEHKISKINLKYAHYYSDLCTAMCTHLNAIRIGAHHYYYDKFEPYRPGYKAHYDSIYKKYFEDPDNKSDKDEYEEFCLAYPEKRLAYDCPCK